MQFDNAMKPISVNRFSKITKRILTSLLCFLLIFTMMFGYMYKEPVVAHATGVEAVFAGVVAGATGTAIGAAAGALIVGAAVVGLGVGVSALAHGNSYYDECQRIWGKLSTAALAGILITGAAAAPVIQMSQTALKEIKSNIISSVVTASAAASFSSEFPVTSFSNGSFSDLASVFGANSNIVLNGGSFSLLRFYRDTLTMADITRNVNIPKTFTEYTVDGVFHTMAISYTGSYFLLYIDNVYTGTSFNLNYGLRVLPVMYVVGSTAYIGGILKNQFNTSTPVNYSIEFKVPYENVGSLDIGHDVINVANDKWYAEGKSILDATNPDVIGSAADAQGAPVGGDIKLYPPIIPALPTTPAGLGTAADKERAQDQQKTLNVPDTFPTTQDKANDDTYNKDKDTTRVSNPDDTEPPSSSPSSGTKIIDGTGGFPVLNHGLDDAFDDLNGLLAYLHDFFLFLAKCFSYLPTQFTIVFVSFVAITVIVRIFGRGED